MGGLIWGGGTSTQLHFLGCCPPRLLSLAPPPVQTEGSFIRTFSTCWTAPAHNIGKEGGGWRDGYPGWPVGWEGGLRARARAGATRRHWARGALFMAQKETRHTAEGQSGWPSAPTSHRWGKHSHNHECMARTRFGNPSLPKVLLFVLHKAISAAAFTTATSNKHGLVCLFLILFFISFVLGEKMVTPESSTQRSSQLLMIIVLCPGPVKKGGSGGVGSVPATLLPGLRTGSTLGQRAATAAEGGQGEPRTP